MKLKIKLLSFFLILGISVVYAYTSVKESLTYLRGAGDTGHIGYIIKELFYDSGALEGKIKQQYLDLPASLTITGASTNSTGIVFLENSTGSFRQDTSPTSNILREVWNNFNSRISSISTIATELTNKITLNPLISSGTYTKITYDEKGLVTSGTGLISSDIPFLDTSKINSGTFEDSRIPNTIARLNSPTFTGKPLTPTPIDGDSTDNIANKGYVDAKIASASTSSSIKFSTCSTTDKQQMFYDCDPILAACSTIGAYCGGGKVAGNIGGNIIVSAISDEGMSTRGYSSVYGNMNPATQVCWEKGTFGFDDWFLPNINELNLLYTNKVAIGGFTDSNYWSSTESNTDTARYLSFNYGSQYNRTKDNACFVRCIRKY